jgi:hypothetical protein
MFGRLISILLIAPQDVVLCELTRVADARNTYHCILDTNMLVHFCKPRILMMTTDDAYKSLSITVGQSLTSITVYLAGRHYTRLAVILHPRWNVSWLEANWTSQEQLVWLRDAKNSVREYFEQQYPPREQSETARTVTGKVTRQDKASQFDQWMQSYDRYMMGKEDELGVYMRQGPVRRENLNPILWWKDHQEEYPRLSKFALDILAIPAMSVDPERTFSVIKLTISLQRHSLSPQIIEEIQCLRNWLGH